MTYDLALSAITNVGANDHCDLYANDSYGKSRLLVTFDANSTPYDFTPNTAQYTAPYRGAGFFELKLYCYMSDDAHIVVLIDNIMVST